jgi:hypothetical protein
MELKKRSAAMLILERLDRLEDKMDVLSGHIEDSKNKPLEEKSVEEANKATAAPSPQPRPQAGSPWGGYSGNAGTYPAQQTQRPWAGGASPQYPNLPGRSVGAPNGHQNLSVGGGQDATANASSTLDIGTLLRLMNDPLVKQVISYFRKKK